MQLTPDQHRRAAALMAQVQRTLDAPSDLAVAAGDERFHREVRVLQRRFQARLTDPLVDAWDAVWPITDNPYEDIDEWDVLSQFVPNTALFDP